MLIFCRLKVKPLEDPIIRVVIEANSSEGLVLVDFGLVRLESDFNVAKIMCATSSTKSSKVCYKSDL
jgi:hypothetical protein